jgi:hypothetical protein
MPGQMGAPAGMVPGQPGQPGRGRRTASILAASTPPEQKRMLGVQSAEPECGAVLPVQCRVRNLSNTRTAPSASHWAAPGSCPSTSRRRTRRSAASAGRGSSTAPPSWPTGRCWGSWCSRSPPRGVAPRGASVALRGLSPPARHPPRLPRARARRPRGDRPRAGAGAPRHHGGGVGHIYS